MCASSPAVLSLSALASLETVVTLYTSFDCCVPFYTSTFLQRLFWCQHGVIHFDFLWLILNRVHLQRQTPQPSPVFCFFFIEMKDSEGGKREPEKVSWRPETSGKASVSLKVLSAAASHKLRYLWLLQNKYTGAKESLTNAPLNYTLPVVRWELWALQEVVLRLLYCFWGLVSGFTKCCMTFVPSRVNMALLTKWVSKP